MGAITSLELFGLDEIILFAFYYKKALDIGANAGRHSMIMAKCGFQVECFEPDPQHYQWLTENLQAIRFPQCERIKSRSCFKMEKLNLSEYLEIRWEATWPE